MSASWLSNRPPRAPGIAGRAALVLLLAPALGVALAVADAGARTAAAPDSGTHVTRVHVTGGGVFVDGNETGDSASTREWSYGDRRRATRERVRQRLRERIHAQMDYDKGPIVVNDSGSGIVRIWSDAHVPAGETVDGDVVAVFGSVTVEGAVTGDVVAVLGSVHLKDGARVDGSAVSVGGRLEQGPGVTVKGEAVQVGITPITFGLPARSVILFAVAAGWLVSMFTGWIFALMFPTTMLRVGTVVERRPAASFFVGLLSMPACLVALVLLCITVIGIPLAVLLPMVYRVMGYAGQLAATAVLGARLSRRALVQGLMTPLLAGTLFVAILLGIGGLVLVGERSSQPVALFFLLSGGLLLLGLGALGTGAFLLSRFGTRPREVLWHGHAPLPHGVVPATGQVSPPATG